MSHIRTIRRRKGQTIVIGEILFVAIGILLLSGTLVTFNMIYGTASSNLEKQSIEQVSSNIVYSLQNFKKIDGCKGKTIIEIPETVSNEPYVIAGFNPPRDEFMIKLGDTKTISKAPMSIKGAVSSSGGRIQINYDGTSALLRGVVYQQD